ncbi:hypothetical protein ACHAXS_004598 [Conticribra weissflogii]
MSITNQENSQVTMNFVHRILKSSTASSISSSLSKSHHVSHQQHQLLTHQIQNAKLLYFGEFHSEPRIIALQTELIKGWAKCLASTGRRGSPKKPSRPRLHVIMEHFSVDMQGILDAYQCRERDGSEENQQQQDGRQLRNSDGHRSSDEEAAFESLVRAYKEDFGTEGHDLRPYRDLLEFCRQTTTHNNPSCIEEDVHVNVDDKNDNYCEVLLHGGFIPRNHAARLNKECPDIDSKRAFFEEMSQRGYLPKPGKGMYEALFAGEDASSKNTYKLRGTREHQLLIESLMNGNDLYSPVEEKEEDDIDYDADNQGKEENEEEESPLKRLYQAQLLKDHAMGYRIASLLMEHHQQNKINSESSSSSPQSPPTDDRYLIIAGFGHLKHRLGVPECVERYLRAEAVGHPDPERRSIAMDVLLNILSHTPDPTSVGRNNNTLQRGEGTALIGCQMMYEAYLEDSYPPMMELMANDSTDNGKVEGGDDNNGSGNEIDVDAKKGELLKKLYLQNPELLDKHILMSDEISGPFLRYAEGIARFRHPCADYLFVYDEDDENIIEKNDLIGSNGNDNGNPQSLCPYHRTQSSNSINDNDNQLDSAKHETIAAYENVGKTAFLRGNSLRARAIMSRLGYTPDDLSYLGDDDLYNFQGVSNPHLVAKIRQGERVLDVGSGLGIDSFLALRDCGGDVVVDASNTDGENHCDGFVVGVDLAESEVKHASQRGKERGYSVPNRLRFLRGDVETLEDAFDRANIQMENAFDVCISNGAFCLVTDKEKAFRNVYKALKSGGRMAISTTTIVSDRLDPSFEWPVCMRMFASLESLKPMCEGIGFRNVEIVDADSPMEGMEIPEEALMDDKEIEKDGAGDSDSGKKRFKIHGKYADQFAFLENIDMDELCKVVTVYGEKP